MNSAKCDFKAHRVDARHSLPAMVASAKCDFRIVADGVSLSTTAGHQTVDLEQGLGKLRASSSKCDFRFIVEDRLDRFSLSAKLVGSAKCDFKVLVDFGIRGGRGIRASGGGSSKCDFVISRIDEVINPDPTK